MADELAAELRNAIFEELERQADVAASYARSIGEAAYRGDSLTAGVHLKQLRVCVLEMIRLYKGELLGNGQNLAAEKGRSAPDRAAQPPGDGVDGRKSQ